MLSLALALATTALPQQGVALKQIPPDSYADSATAALVRNARAARERNERLVTSYTAQVSQRFGVGIAALARDRMLYRQELVAKISWNRDSKSTIEYLGAREGVPIAMRGDQVPDLDGGNGLVIDPSSEYLRGFGIGVNGSGGDALVLYPLADGSETSYKFALGETVTLSLPGGKIVRIVALTVIPRSASPSLMSGTLWYDAESYNLVRAVYRPARPWDLRRDADKDDRDEMPGWLSGQLEVKFVTLEYGLYENRWWMPRLMAIDAEGTAGAWLGVPFRMERLYSEYEVQGGTPPDPASTFRPAGRVLQPAERAVRDSVRNAMRDRGDTTWRLPDSNLVVIVPKDTASLLTSTLLGPPILDMGDMVSEDELRQIAGPLKKLPARPWETHVELPRSLGSLLQNARYNRIEALSLGTSIDVDFGKLKFKALGRFGLADLEPSLDLVLTKQTTNGMISATAYRRLAAANPEANPFSAPNSALALLAQRDDGEYYRTLGAEITARNTNRSWWSGRVYYQQERAVTEITTAAVPHVFSKKQLFRPNIVADSADQIGASLTLRGNKVFSRTFTLGASATLDAATGDFDYQRGALTLRGFITPNSPWAIGLAASAGTTMGTVTTQGQFFLGSPMSLRGYAGGAARGESFWLMRADVGRGIPGARLIGFSDIGWAGPRTDFMTGQPLISVGVGVSLLDGLIRIDLAKRLRGDKGMRLEFYIDGVM